jgi:hypothetical protein
LSSIHLPRSSQRVEGALHLQTLAEHVDNTDLSRPTRPPARLARLQVSAGTEPESRLHPHNPLMPDGTDGFRVALAAAGTRIAVCQMDTLVVGDHVEGMDGTSVVHRSQACGMPRRDGAGRMSIIQGGCRRWRR